MRNTARIDTTMRHYDLPPLAQLEAFEASARHLSFTKAADELALTQSAVSRQIAALEAHYGLALFRRLHRALRLTDEGQTLFQAVAEVLGQLHAGATSCDEDDIVELANGCICCTVAEDFIPTMEKLLSRPQRPDAIIIETSGLALPQPLVRAFAWPEIKTELTVDAVVTLVDAAAVSEGRFAADEAAVDRQRQADEMLDHETPLSELFEDQVACADLIVLSKSDLVDEAGLAAVEARIREDSRKGVKIIRSNRGALPIEVLIGQNSKAENEERFSHHELEHLAAGQDIAAHDHGHDEFETFIVELPAVADSKILLGRIEGAMRAHDILRLKGFAAISGKDTRLLIQAVGQRVESYFDRPWRASEKQATRLVVIGEAGLNRAAIAKDLGGNLRA